MALKRRPTADQYREISDLLRLSYYAAREAHRLLMENHSSKNARESNFVWSLMDRIHITRLAVGSACHQQTGRDIDFETEGTEERAMRAIKTFRSSR